MQRNWTAPAAGERQPNELKKRPWLEIHKDLCAAT